MDNSSFKRIHRLQRFGFARFSYSKSNLLGKLREGGNSLFSVIFAVNDKSFVVGIVFVDDKQRKILQTVEHVASDRKSVV